jgi:hypothetical protein
VSRAAVLRPTARGAVSPGATAAVWVSLLFLFAAGGSAQTLPRSVVACGGAVTGGPDYSVVGTVGQALVGLSVGPTDPELRDCSGWWCGEFGTVVAVAMPEREVPRVTRLAPPAPNPGSGPVRLAYDLARDGRVEIDVYAVSGARVRSIVREARPAGRHEARWDGRGHGGEAVASGIYFVVFRVDGKAAGRRRVVLIR